MFADVSGPLHRMLQAGKFDGRKGSTNNFAWTTEDEEPVDKLRERLLGLLGLLLADLDKGFVLCTDTSDYAVGADLE